MNSFSSSRVWLMWQESTYQLHCTTNFDFFPVFETKYVSLYRFWDTEQENGHEKA
jgi:hypothetical protein